MKNTALPDVVPVLTDHLSVRGGRLFIEDRDAVDLAGEFGTPLYVMSEQRLLENFRAIHDALSTTWPGDVRVLASFKANHVLALRQLLTDVGAGCDCFGLSELHGALTSGVPSGLLSVNGSFKSEEVIRLAIATGARIAIDALYELDLIERITRETGTKARVVVRLRPWLGDIATPSDLRREFSLGMALHMGKYGVPAEDVDPVIRRCLECEHIDLRGFHFHAGRHSLDPEVWQRIGQGVAAEVSDRCERFAFQPVELDVGGGIPNRYDAIGRAESYDDAFGDPLAAGAYVEALIQGILEGLDGRAVDPSLVRLEVEPGRGLFGDAGVHLTRVIATKSVSRPVPWMWVGVDTSVVNLHDISFLHGRFTHVVANRVEEPATLRADIVGLTCMTDRITPDAQLPEVESGDVIAFLGTGAYQEASAANFNALPRPATVLVSGADAFVIRRRETSEDVFGRDLLRPQAGR